MFPLTLLAACFLAVIEKKILLIKQCFINVSYDYTNKNTSDSNQIVKSLYFLFIKPFRHLKDTTVFKISKILYNRVCQIHHIFVVINRFNRSPLVLIYFTHIKTLKHLKQWAMYWINMLKVLSRSLWCFWLSMESIFVYALGIVWRYILGVLCNDCLVVGFSPFVWKTRVQFPPNV